MGHYTKCQECQADRNAISHQDVEHQALGGIANHEWRGEVGEPCTAGVIHNSGTRKEFTIFLRHYRLYNL